MRPHFTHPEPRAIQITRLWLSPEGLDQWRIGQHALTVLAILGGITIFLLAWQKHSVEAEAEVTTMTAVKDDAQKFQREIKQGAAYTLEQWPEVAKTLGITNMNTARQVLGAPNLITDEGFRWVYYDRLIHPVTELPSDLGISFDEKKNLTKLEAYP